MNDVQPETWNVQRNPGNAASQSERSIGMEPTVNDPFRYCETDGCTHDLSAGALVSELLDRDGPHPVRARSFPPAAVDHVPDAA